MRLKGSPLNLTLDNKLELEPIKDFKSLELQNIEQLKDIKKNLSPFCLSTFLARYLSGNKNLKELRTVSRKQLALASCGVGYLNVDATLLNNQIKKYVDVKSYLESKEFWTVTDILDANKLLTPELESSGKFRNIQNWISSSKGKGIEYAEYICPPPENIHLLMNNWLQFVNNKNINPELRAVIGHSQFVNIHPFLEGNGRLSRVITEVLYNKGNGERINLLLYRLKTKAISRKKDDYILSLDTFKTNIEGFNINDARHKYWQASIDWGGGLLNQVEKIVNITQGNISRRIGLFNLTPNAKQLIDYIWNQPIVCEKGLSTAFNWSLNSSHQAITDLVHLKILEPRKLKSIQNVIIYDCPIIFEAWKNIDDCIYTI